jgi:hypothetical protein
MTDDSPPGPPRFRLTGTTAGPRTARTKKPAEKPPARTAPAQDQPAAKEPEPPRRIPESARFRRGDVYSRPVVEGRELQDNAWSRLRGRLRTLATSDGERREQELGESLTGAPKARRSNTIAVVSPKGGGARPPAPS